MRGKTMRGRGAAPAAASKYMAFVSYAHSDDAMDNGWIRKAAMRLEREVACLVGLDFPFYIDAFDTPAGQWRPNHNEVLDTVPFLIPFVTPRFLKSKACRHEVDRFDGRDPKGIIVPVFYIGCSPDDDEEKRIWELLYAYQGVQWRELREKCCAVDSPAVTRELRNLAAFIKDAYRAVRAAPKVGEHERPKAAVRGEAEAGPAEARVPEAEEPRMEVRAPGFEYLRKNTFGFEEYRSAVDGAEMVRIPAGMFKMGSNESDNEKPVHEVRLRDYCIDKYLVTNAQYRRFCDATGRDYPSDPGFSGMQGYFTKNTDYPVVNVSWEDARAYCEWAGKRLPTEAEWEKAARGQDGRKYPWGSEEPDGSQCNFADKRSGFSWADKSVDDGFAQTSPVRQYPAGASPYGVMDMAGNVWEWCNDWYADDYYKTSPADNPKGPSSGSSRALRGGSWVDRSAIVRCSCRTGNELSTRNGFVGFRCAVGA
jgi:formylglycine-generating enzyme required for sulfatase activity